MSNELERPNRRYLRVEDVNSQKIPYLAPIEVGLSSRAVNHIRRGDLLETELLYYAGTEKNRRYGTLLYHKKLLNGSPTDEPSGIMLPLIEWIRPLSSSRELTQTG